MGLSPHQSEKASPSSHDKKLQGRNSVFGDQCGVSVEEGDRIDLAARAPVLGSGLNVAGSDVSFQGLITNNGNKSVRAPFQNRFQIDIGGDGTYDLTLDTPREVHTVPLRWIETVMSPVWKNIPSGTQMRSRYGLQSGNMERICVRWYR